MSNIGPVCTGPRRAALAAGLTALALATGLSLTGCAHNKPSTTAAPVATHQPTQLLPAPDNHTVDPNAVPSAGVDPRDNPQIPPGAAGEEIMGQFDKMFTDAQNEADTARAQTIREFDKTVTDAQTRADTNHPSH